MKLGEYILALNPSARAYCIPRISAICRFIEGNFDMSKKGYMAYVKECGYSISSKDRSYICDWMAFAGIRIASKRKERTPKIVTRKDLLTEANRKKIAAYLEWCQSVREYSPASISSKSDHMRIFFSYFTEFNQENVRSFIATREAEGLHPKSLNMYMLTFKQYGDFVKRPVILKKYAVSRHLMVENVPTEKEYNRLIEWCRSMGTS